MTDILVLGNFVVDVIGKPVDRLPAPGQLLFLDTLETHVGGNAPNTAAALATLGGSVGVVGRVGEDVYGRFLLEELQARGVDTRPVVHDPEEPTGVSMVCVDSRGERSFLHHLGANRQFGPADVPDSLFAGARHLHLASQFVLPALDGAPAADVLRRAREAGLATSLDVCWDASGRWLETLGPSLRWVKDFLPSEDEARQLAGTDDLRAIAGLFHDLGVDTVVIKRGERGCYASASGQQWSVHAYDVPARETTGAGDCFIAGWLYARGAGFDVPASLALANACGARCVREFGAVTGIAPASEILAWQNGTPLRER